MRVQFLAIFCFNYFVSGYSVGGVEFGTNGEEQVVLQWKRKSRIEWSGDYSPRMTLPASARRHITAPIVGFIHRCE